MTTSPYTGRSITFTWNSHTILGVREKGVTQSGAPIDITGDDSAGARTILASPSQNDINIKLAGVTKDRFLKDDWWAGTRTRAILLTYPDGTTLAGSFFLVSYTETNSYKDAAAFDAELQSTGAMTYTPGS